jgi:hypothetical protein
MQLVDASAARPRRRSAILKHPADLVSSPIKSALGLAKDSNTAQQGGEASPTDGGRTEMPVRGQSYLAWLPDRLVYMGG